MTTPGRGDAIRRARAAVSEHGATMRARYEHGERLADIAADYEIGLASVARAVRINGGTVRKRGIRPGQGTGERNAAWKGGRYVHRGYVYVWLPPDHPMAVMRRSRRGYVLEHRLVMAEAIGRPLRDDETVHHVDGDQSNNDLANLQLRQGRHGKGGCYVCLDCGSCNVAASEL